MLRRLCQGLLLSLLVLGLAVPATSHTMADQAVTEAPCPDLDMSRHCLEGVDFDCLAGCLAATPALSFTLQPSPAPWHWVIAQASVVAPDAGYRGLPERPPSHSV